MILNEFQSFIEYGEDIDKITQKLKKYTRIIEIYKNNNKYLYHGNKLPNEQWNYAYSNHTPSTRIIDRDANPRYVNYFNDWIVKKNGINTTTRDNSIFCYSNKEDTKFYSGEFGPYVVFPDNDFKFLYSLDVFDFVPWSLRIEKKIDPTQEKDQFELEFEKATFSNSNLELAFNNDCEILISHCNYFLIQESIIDSIIEKL